MAARPAGEGGILDPEHDLEVKEEAAHVAVRRAHIGGLVDDEELGVELGRPILEDPRTAPQQPRIGVPRRRDRRLVVGLRRGDDPRRAPPRQAADAAEHARARREIGGDDVRAARVPQIAAERTRPRAQPPRRSAEQPAQRAVALAPLRDQSGEIADAAGGKPRPCRQIVEIAREMARRRSLDEEAEVAPAVGPVVEIAVLDVEAADQCPFLVGERHLLVVAQQVAPADARQEAAGMAARLLQRRQEIPVEAAAEAVDDQAHRHAAPRCRHGRIAHPPPGGIVGERIVEEAQRIARAFDGGDERVQPFGPGDERRQPVAVDFDGVCPWRACRDAAGRAQGAAFLDLRRPRRYQRALPA
ncbi:hypothetical protein SLE2022_405750 [Rubroshorea leprosula]